MKKLVIAGVLISSMFSETYCTSYQNVFYTGISAGVTHASGNRDDLSYNLVNNARADFNNNKRFRSNGGQGGLIAGYLLRLENFGIGPEFFYDYGKLENTADGTLYDPGAGPTVTSFNIKNKITNRFGFSTRFGYCIESYFTYILLGSIRQKEKLTITARQSDNGNPAGSYYFRKNKHTSRFSYGLGVQKAITEVIELGLEYKTSRFPKKDYTFYLSDADRTYVKTSLKYRLHTLAVRLIYKF